MRRLLSILSLSLASMLLLLGGSPPPITAEAPSTPSLASDGLEERAGFALSYKGDRFPHRVSPAFVSPGEVLEIDVEGSSDGERFTMEISAGELLSASSRSWRWRAPMSPGLHPIRIFRTENDESVTVNVFVLVPADRMRDERLEGYRIGSYPDPRPQYDPPEGFIEVTPDNVDASLSPRFRLGQFLCKQEGGFPKYVFLREKLILKLEHLLDEVNREGHGVDTFHVMSGYRTPHYNRSIGNVPLSRHVFGDAADIFIDADGNGLMDDLDRDGRIGIGDAQVLYDVVDRGERALLATLIGGLGKYRATKAHGPFVHVDTRGRPARW